MKRRLFLVRTIMAAICLAGILLAHPASAAIDLGLASDYVVLGIGSSNATPKSSFEVYQSGTVVTGNVGVGPNSTWTHGMDATINGRLDNDPTSLPLPTITGTISGGVTMPFPNMRPVVQDAINAANFYSSLTPTQTYLGLANIPNQTLVGNGGLNVINITGNVAFKTTLTLMGGPNDIFVFQYTSPLKDPLVLSGAKMILNGVNTDNILWVVNGKGDGFVQITSSAVVYGNFLAPFRNIIVDNATVIGRVIGGGEGAELSIHSSSTVILPEPGTYVAAALMLVPLGLGALRRLRKSC